ncbi:MAG: LysM peptidoglycan-binding domain-containing protein, partial [Steroidobacteraceae bacterium]
MFTNQRLEAGAIAAGFIACTLVAAGCTWGSRDRVASESVSATAQSTAAADASAVETAADEDMTATEAAANAQAAAQSAEPAPEPASPSDVLQPTAPKSYTVKRGDTLWDIASTFLRDPWYWPEVWYINPQVENPHLIYPGDVLALAFGADGRPQIRLQSGGPARLNPRLRTSPLEGPIQTIPYSAIASFLSRPSVLEADEVRRA